MSAARDTIVSVTGIAAMAPLLPPEMAAGTGDGVPLRRALPLRERRHHA